MLCRKPSLCALVLICALGSQIVAFPQNLPPEVVAYPHTILLNGKILTVDQDFSIAEALAVWDDRILAVGSNEAIMRMAGPETEKIDLEGKTAIPGLIDSHYHLADYAICYMLLEEKGIQWEGDIQWLGLYWDEKETALRDIRRAVNAARPDELVRVMVTIRPLEVLSTIQMEELDAISPRNPVILVNQLMSPRAVNTQAIAWAKIPPNTPGLPDDGGIAIGGQTRNRLADLLRWIVPIERVIPWHKKTMNLVNSWGVTTVATRVRPEDFTALREIWLDGELTVRWRVAFPGPLDIARTGNLSDLGDDWLRISGAGSGYVPGFSLPNIVSHWSSQVSPGPEAQAALAVEWSARRQQILEALRYGWSLPNSHVHGDLAVREFLNLVEEAQRSPVVRSSNQRLTMDHMEEVADTDIPRMKELGVIPSSLLKDVFIESKWASSGYEAVFGSEYVNKLLPLKKYLDAGIRPTIEADTGEKVAGEPLWTIEKAITRKVDGSSRVWGADQTVTRQDALRMKTIWPAAYTGDESELGSLEPGKLADVVVLDRDYLTVPEEEISELTVVMTMVGGKIVYRD